MWNAKAFSRPGTPSLRSVVVVIVVVAVVLNYGGGIAHRGDARDVNLFLRVSEFAASRYKRYYAMVYPAALVPCTSSRGRVAVKENKATTTTTTTSVPGRIIVCVRTTDFASRSKGGDEILTGSFAWVVPLLPR